MFNKSIKATIAAVFLATSGAAPALASDVGAAIVGGIIGGVIVNEAHKDKRRKQAAAARYSATRAYNRETQTALNYFGFNAGSPDGVMGRRSKAAITQYQVYVGFPATGNLTQYERDFLVTSYNRAQVGGAQVVKAMQSHQHGVRSLLAVWHEEATGVRTPNASGYAGMPVEVSQAIDEVAESSEPSAEQLMQRSGFIQLVDLNGDGKTDYILDTSVTGSSFWCGDQSCTVMVFASSSQGYKRNDFLTNDATPAMFSCHQSVCRVSQSSTTQVVVAPQPTPVINTPPPSTKVSNQNAGNGLNGITLFNTGPKEAAAPSLASHCSKVSLLTSSNGGFMTVSNMNDPELAMSEQFCLARTYAIGTGENMTSALQGVTAAQVDQQCDAFGPALAPYVAKLGTTDAAALTGEVQKFVLTSNMSIDQLANTAKICLFSGYRRDQMDVALGSALLMVGLGQKPYGELVGHHVAQGYGAAADPERAQGWYMMAIEALEGGAEAAFAPGQPERVALLRAAVNRAPGGLAQPQPAAALPTFKLGE